jgi:hypothetical protein
VQDQFELLLKKEKLEPFIEWIKTTDITERRAFAPSLKKLAKDYLKYQEVRRGLTTHYEQKASEKQRKIILVACFVCYTQAEYEKSEFPGWILDRELLNLVIDWYHPEWFSDFVNKLAANDQVFYNVDYGYILALQTKGVLSPSSQLINSYLPQYIFRQRDKFFYCDHAVLLEHPVTIQEHIWLLFEEGSNLHYAGRWHNLQPSTPNEPTDWIGIFTKYSDEGLIDRQRLLQQSLLASNRNFNKILSGWFVDLFTVLKPSVPELISLQKELFSMLHSQHSKVVNAALAGFKKIAKESSFDINLFLENTGVLLTSTTKSTVSSALMIMDKLAIRYPDRKQAICVAATQALMHADDELQTRAAKLITDHAATNDEEFIHALAVYQNSLMVSASALLYPWLQPVTAIDIEEAGAGIVEAASGIPILSPETFDDLIFFCSQAFDNNQPWHFDLLPSALLQWQANLQASRISALEPALQRAIRTVRNGTQANAGTIDHLMAMFFIDVCVLLTRQFPGESIVLKNLFEADDIKRDDNTKWLAVSADASYIEKYELKDRDPFYTPFLLLLQAALYKFKTADKLPLLSTPTHEPTWIDPLVFVKRLQQYVQAKSKPHSIDMQVAISRCDLSNTAEAVLYVDHNLKGEIKNLLRFLLVEDALPEAPFSEEEFWMTVSLAKKNKQQYPAFSTFSYYQKPLEYYTGRFAFNSIVESRTNQRYDYAAKKYVDYTDTNTILKLVKSDVKQTGGWMKNIVQKILPAKQSTPLLFDYMRTKAMYFWSQHTDVQRAIFLAPNNPEPFLSAIAETALKHGNFWEEGGKKAVIKSLQAMLEIWRGHGTMADLFVATSMINSDKTAAGIAVEIWLKATIANTIDSHLMGEIMGMHFKVAYSPLKRFTDLAVQSMYNIYPQTDKALLVMIEAMMTALPDEPPKNLKKLLELYRELLAKFPGSGSDKKAIVSKLEAWKSSSSVKPLAEALLKQV